MASATRADKRHRQAAGPARAALFSRLVPGLLILVLLGLLPVPALAPNGAFGNRAGAEDSMVTFRGSYFSDISEPQAYYFDIIAAAGIARGDSGLGGRCRPSEPITRAEFAVMALRLLTVDPAFSDPGTTSLPFRDATTIPSWATEAVATCAGLGIVNGEPDGLGGFNFQPGDNVSGAEAVAMLLRVLRNSENIVGGWPNGYFFRAFETGLFSSEVDAGDWRFVQPLSPLTRAQMAYLVSNALFCSRGYRPGEPGREGTFTLASIGGRLSGYSLIIDADLLMRSLVAADGQTLHLAGTVVASGVRGSADLVGRRVFWLENTKGQIAFLRRYGQEAAVTGTLDSLALGKDGARVDRVLLADGRVITCASGAIVELNGQRWPFDPAAILPVATVTAIMDGGQAAYVSVIQEDLPEAVIRTITFDPPPAGAAADRPTTGRITARISMGAGDIPLVVTADTSIYLDGKPADLSDLREWDVFYAATGGATPKTAVRLYAYRDRITGRVAGVSRLYDLTGFHWQLNIEDTLGKKVTLGFGAFCKDLASTSLTGQELVFCLNRLGEISYFRPPGPTPAALRVVKSLRLAQVHGKRLLTVDWQGSELTYDLPAEIPSPSQGSLVRLMVTADGGVSRTEPVFPALFAAVVVSYDEATDRLSLTRDQRLWTLNVRYVPVYATASAGEPPAGPDAPPPAIGAAVPVQTLVPGQAIWLEDPGAPGYMLVLGQ